MREVATIIPDVVDHSLESVSVSVDKNGLPFLLLRSNRHIFKEFCQIRILDGAQKLLADHDRVSTSHIQLKREHLLFFLLLLELLLNLVSFLNLIINFFQFISKLPLGMAIFSVQSLRVIDAFLNTIVQVLENVQIVYEGFLHALNSLSDYFLDILEALFKFGSQIVYVRISFHNFFQFLIRFLVIGDDVMIGILMF